MFGLFGSKSPTRQNPYATAEAAVKNTGRVWDSADVEKRAKLLEGTIDIENDRMFLAFVNAPWSQLPESTRLKLSETLIKRDTEEYFVRTATKHMGEIVADSYSEAEFDALFGPQKYDEKWSREHALGIWYGLGRFCLFISIGQLQRLREQDFETAVSAGDNGLLGKWKMSDSTRKTYGEFSALKIPPILQIYRQIDGPDERLLFFLMVVSEIQGNEINVSLDDFSKGCLELLLRGLRIDVDPIVLSKLSSMFSKVLEAVQLFDKMLPI